jgi:hypothetical protein
LQDISSAITKYGDPARLADVMALIQVLALDDRTHRSEKGLASELQGNPMSVVSWTELARQHSEFFRVNKDDERQNVVSLIARHVLPKNAAGVRVLPSEFVGKLLEAAISLHDREVTRKDSWKWLIPVLIAILTSVISIIVALLKNSEPR